ncbi:hypothetical protein JDV02_007528 [Purpureocillium takamizusanense]|uniref:Uncharacterized protein n=1 Tax=Purpureocillium takamizusanense TaxID=2060973 RepID=A0A9Q8QKR2_9HYPO|nr:uncharacterized protein JDV02_007528 [Purpureocillium takamizusanense]UNI21548.1 hypothetical protein JDV02_007528 [Purpureocillium takamizusanense]
MKLADVPTFAEAPPRLDVLSELPSDGLHRSSTFRTSLEKAVEDINVKYGTTRLPEKQVGAIGDGDGVCSTRPPPYYARSNFQPRYRLPQFVTIPPVRTQPTVGELKTGSPYSSKSTSNVAGSPLSDFHIDNILNRALSGTKAAKDQSSAIKQEVPALDKCESVSGSLSSLAGGTTAPIPDNQRDETQNFSTQGQRDAADKGEPFVKDANCETESLTADEPYAVADSIPGTFPAAFEDEKPHLHFRTDKIVPNIFCWQTPKEEDSSQEEGPKHPSSLVIGRVRDVSDSSDGLTETDLAGLQKARSHDSTSSACHEHQRAPSVSELVSKFGRMASSPKGPNGSVGRGVSEQQSLCKTVTFGTGRRQMSLDSGDGESRTSGSDNPDMVPVEIAAKSRRIESSTDISGHHGLC